MIGNFYKGGAANVSMKSGLEGRNNLPSPVAGGRRMTSVSMKSGLEGRNNGRKFIYLRRYKNVSMKSGLEGRNNVIDDYGRYADRVVSMKSGLEGRNNGELRQGIEYAKRLSQ